MINILFIGDIIGRVGRETVKKVLPDLKKEKEIDFVIANAENLAHGMGVTEKTVAEMLEAGVDLLTSGNHLWDKKDYQGVLEKHPEAIIRPANYPPEVPGKGYRICKIGGSKILVLNLIGRVFFPDDYDCPFRKADEILEEFKNENLGGIIIDFHAEATSEKNALGFYLDGKVSAVIGTHTHIPTEDYCILPKGTAYVTDTGMTGPLDSVLGVKKEIIIKNFLTQMPQHFEVQDEGEGIFNAVYLEIDPKTKRAKKVEKIKETVKL